MAVERELPCDGTDVLIAFRGPECMPMTSGKVDAILSSANTPICSGPVLAICDGDADCPSGEVCRTAMIGPVSAAGSPAECSSDDINLSGLGLRGALSFFDTVIGDVLVEVRADCQ
jgi:hypothetical protein